MDWTKGEQAIIPKDESNGLMISAFQSHEFGFGMTLTPEELEKVNKFRREKRPLYTEAEAAIRVNGTAIKKTILNSPFVLTFEYGYGAGKEGYWNYDHMCLQFEDCVDTIQALYPDYDSVWIFDHSCGHDRGREDGLPVGNMKLNWGGKQSRVRDTEIKEKVGYLGPHSPLLKVGDIQKMCFEEGDDGPYYMSPINRELHRYDEVKGKKVKKRLKKDMCQDLERLGFNVRGKTIKEVQEMATAANLPTMVQEDDVVEGWVGKPKGIKQVLWERGLLDPQVTYASKIKKDDPNYEEKVEYSTVLADCADFLNEKTSLKADCLSTKDEPKKGGLTTEMVRKFSRRARQYILAYFYIEHEMKENVEEGLHEINIEQIKKEFKTHRSAIDFDEKFINYCFQKCDEQQQSAGSSKQQQAREKEP